MSNSVYRSIRDLIDYAVANGLATEEDRVYFTNRYLDEFRLSSCPNPEPKTGNAVPPLGEILDSLCGEAAELGVIPDNGPVQHDLFDTRLMSYLTPKPSDVIARFRNLYSSKSPRDATDDFYRLCCLVNYVRTERIAKNLKWTYSGKYGALDITVNLSKPEKDPKAIAAARLQKASGYPQCVLCRENEGFAGSLTQQARQNIRLIPVTMDGSPWFLQYSPYAYYNEHCIVLSGTHTPMKIDRGTFRKLMDFETLFPHYFLGSNADLPIVGGSILSHDHMQGGRYTFAIERAPIEIPLEFSGFSGVRAGIVHWPLSVIRLTSSSKDDLIELSDRILSAWRNYTDESASVFAETDGQPHNTITPIARRSGSDYELDLVLRNNLTTPEHPLGLYHPHADKHHIKKENIGLIEVMGLAVLPARLKAEMALVREAVLNGKDLSEDPRTQKHAAWFEQFRNCYSITPDTITDILKQEIGKTFEGVLKDAGVYSCTPDGREAFLRFVSSVG